MQGGAAGDDVQHINTQQGDGRQIIGAGQGDIAFIAALGMAPDTASIGQLRLSQLQA